ncbi:acyltransferase-like protein At3g26840, chloroplastic isoform X1 [Zingiber officinale]|uniref:acyltransferase-like protein At3g26840, chloroplastic isoform X1 n=1 Tax=Zingiber officinale TaxID=94328 RepID=UPI001C4B4193|nr:acyltransferase-like protein At3g26840, chloroplastic isoform X1 [Zingiber officinale]
MATAAAALSVPLPLRLSPPQRRRFLCTSRAEVTFRTSGGAVASKVLDDSAIKPRDLRDYIEQSREIIRPDGGPPRWLSPIECGARGKDSPLLLYLPGIDGTGLGLIRHHERLGKIFDIWCLHIPVMDRTTFAGLVELVERTIKSEESYIKGKPIYLVGESIGACVALAVAARNQNVDLILILANPATSFSKSQLQSLSQLHSFTTFLRVLPEPLHATISNSFRLITGSGMDAHVKENAIHQIFGGLPENLNKIFDGLSFLVDILPMESLFWKLDLLKSASLFVNSRLHVVKNQTLIVASGRDLLLPSREEADRLRNLLPNSRIRHFQESGHAIFLESSIDLVSIVKGAGFYRRSRQLDYVSDYLSMTPDEFQKVADQYRWVDLAANPVMLSTLQNGKIVNGLSGIPSEGPAVFVGYHMLMGLELGPLFTRFLTEKKIHLRGIAHPFLFNRDTEQLMPDSSSFDSYRVVGAVPVSAPNFYKLLSAKASVLLYPGGAREALHRKGEEYKLFWPEKPEFVRMAARFGATIIPFGVIGEDDICNVLLDYDDLLKIPFFDILSKQINGDAVRLRADSNEEVGNQNLYPPVLLPKIPGRLYFLFGKPIETKGMRLELSDRSNAQQLYLHVKSEVENCIAYLKEKREEDPYRNFLPRLLYQTTHGFEAEVPTFKL